MDKANEMINKIIREVLTALYQPFGAAVLLTFVAMFVFIYAKEHNWQKKNLIKKICSIWFSYFKKSDEFRRVFLLLFYSTMILVRTIINREIWFDPSIKRNGNKMCKWRKQTNDINKSGQDTMPIESYIWK